MIKIEVNKGTTKIKAKIKPSNTAVELVSVIMALADVAGKEHIEDFKNMLRVLIEDEDSPLNNIEKFKERK